MKVLLLHPEQDFDYREPLPKHADCLTQDLSIEPLLQAMAGNDPFVLTIVRCALLNAPGNDMATVHHRQMAVQDALSHPADVRAMYELAVQTIAEKRHYLFFDLASVYPTSTLFSGVALMRLFVEKLRLLRGIAEQVASGFRSPAFSALFASLQREVGEDYLTMVQVHLKNLEVRQGVSLTAALADDLQVTGHSLSEPNIGSQCWLKQLFHSEPGRLSFELGDRDDAGARSLSRMKDQGLNEVANAMAQAAEHVLHFFEMLQAELAFYVGCINLHERLGARGIPTCLPHATPTGSWQRRFEDLRDAGLALTMDGPVVGNTVNACGKPLWIVTGANQGGKSSFLRSFGLAQLMMQAGLFVAARAFRSDLCSGVFTHYRREEDDTMTSGKFDEEMRRMNALIDGLQPGALVLFNESFASTNEREGAEVATEITDALLACGIGVVHVTHMFALSNGYFQREPERTLFLRAERSEDGSRPFSLIVAPPLPTAYGEDVYRLVFGIAAPKPVGELSR